MPELDFEIELKGELGRLAGLGLRFARLREAAEKAAAESWTFDVHKWIHFGSAFTPRTGYLENSINWRFDPVARKAIVYANAPYASYVEEGTDYKEGTERNRPYPYLRVDMERRKARMVEAAKAAIRSELRRLVGLGSAA